MSRSQPATPAPTPAIRPSCVVLTGNPNCGKTTVFNALTGLRAKVGNYAGVTVERKEGRLKGGGPGGVVTVLDLPGTYSLSPQSLDEQIARDVLLHRLSDVPAPDLVVVVVDASNLQRNLYYATQVIELGYPTVVALNMVDVARETGHEVDVEVLSRELGVMVVPMVANRGEGIPELRRRILEGVSTPAARGGDTRVFRELPDELEREVQGVAERLAQRGGGIPRQRLRAEALLVLCDEKVMDRGGEAYDGSLREWVKESRGRMEAAGMDWRTRPIEARYARVAGIESEAMVPGAAGGETWSDRLDRWVTHRVWGVALFLLIMTVMFQSIFSFAQIPMEAIQGWVDALGGAVGRALPEGDLNSLLVDGVIAGVGAVVVFLPQILLLFLFIGFLEDTGYMARAAFLMDRLMSKVGLHGKSFIPMLSSFACAIPGIMATRTIETPKDRLVTILVAPLMSCSARLPVYTLLIAACIPQRRIWGVLTLSGLTMLSMYLLGIVVALLMAWLFKKTLLRGATPMLIMELPPYKRPVPGVVLRHMWDRSKLFLRRAGTVILGINILLWAAATYPRSDTAAAFFESQREEVRSAAVGGLEERLAEIDHAEAGAKLRHSLAGRVGRLIEPAIAPLGFDWKMGIGIVTSFAAREVFVSTMSVVYNVGADRSEEEMTRSLAETMRAQRRENGTMVYTPLVAVTLMVFYVFALQCVSTVAVVRRETNSWKWPLFQWVYMGALAWGLAFVTYQGGRLLGLG